MAGFQEVAGAVQRGPKAPFKVATLPKDCGGDKVSVGGISSFMQIDAFRVAEASRGGDTAAAMELVKRSIARKNGQPFMMGNAEFDAWFEGIGPRGRDLLTSLYNARNAVAKDERAAFLDTMTEEET